MQFQTVTRFETVKKLTMGKWLATGERFTPFNSIISNLKVNVQALYCNYQVISMTLVVFLYKWLCAFSYRLGLSLTTTRS